MPNTDTVKLANAAKLLMEYEKRPLKADEFLDSQYSFFYKYGEERRVCQFIFLTVLRNKLLIDTILAVFEKNAAPRAFRRFEVRMRRNYFRPRRQNRANGALVGGSFKKNLLAGRV